MVLIVGGIASELVASEVEGFVAGAVADFSLLPLCSLAGCGSTASDLREMKSW